MTVQISRRRLFLGAAALVAAPAIVRVSSLMPVTSAEPAIQTAVFDWVRQGTTVLVRGHIQVEIEALCAAHENCRIMLASPDFMRVYDEVMEAEVLRA